MEKYNLEVTKKQLELISFIADNYSRIMAGQLNISFKNILIEAGQRHKTDKDSDEIHNMATNYCKKLEHDFWNLKNGRYYGVNYSEKYNILTDINHVIRHQLYQDRGDAQKMTVDAFPAHKFAKEPLIKIQKIYD